jgi:hypothetical protein
MGDDCQGHVIRMTFEYTAESCAATHDSQAAGKVSCTDSGPLTIPVRVLVTNNDGSKVWANVSNLNVGGMVVADAANAGTATVAGTTRVKIFNAATGALLQESLFDTSCSQPLNLGDQFGAMSLVALRTTDGGDVSLDPAQCDTELPSAPPPPNCLGKVASLRLQYRGGGCAAMNNSQPTDKIKCTQYVASPNAAPVRIRATDGPGGVVWLDTGTPANVALGDVVDVIASSAAKTTLTADTAVSIFDASNTLIERVQFKTDCSQPVNLGDVFGGFTVFGMRTTNGGAVALGADVNYTYAITNNGSTTVSNVTVQDDKLGTVPGSPIGSLAPGASLTLSARQSLTATTVNTVTVSGNSGLCSAQAKAAIVAPCVLGYPFSSTEPRTSVLFNESEVLRALQPGVAGSGGRLKVFYNDEHALTLGVRRVLVKTNTGTSMTDYAVSPLTTNPGGMMNPQVGTMTLDGDQAGTDASQCAGFPDRCDRPMFPAVFITDITNDPSSTAGDWQFGGTPIRPSAVYGTWKAAVRMVDRTKNPPVVTVTPDADPTKNNWNLDGGDPAPAGLTNEGYGAEIVWNVDALGLIEGHVYRVQVVVHDGDQNKTGGDTGAACATLFVP